METFKTMTVLSDRSIKQQVKSGNLTVQPFEEVNVQPSSLDVRLGDQILLADQHYILDPYKDNAGCFTSVTAGEEGTVLNGLRFALASTVEYFEIPNNLIARVEGKSSLGRLGLQVHLTAGFIDPGFKGNITLELFNTAPWGIKLYKNMLIAQIAFQYLDNPVVKPYGHTNSKYQHDRGPQTSRYYLNEKPLNLQLNK